MVSYKELGLVNTRDMFAKAVKGGYAIPAYNFNNRQRVLLFFRFQRAQGTMQISTSSGTWHVA